MRATKMLPDSYREIAVTDLSKNRSLMLGLTLCGLLLFFVFGYLFWSAANLLVPGFIGSGRVTVDLWIALEVIGVLAVIVIAILLLHELTHGLFFWLFTRELPVFGLKALFAYAAAPNWYIPRVPFIIIGLAPIVLLTLLGLALIPLVPPLIILALVFALTMNATGAVGDLYIVIFLLTRPAIVIVRDYGDGMAYYGPANPLKRPLDAEN